MTPLASYPAFSAQTAGDFATILPAILPTGGGLSGNL
jgi:hypothetical protein